MHPPHMDSPERLELIARAQPERLTAAQWKKIGEMSEEIQKALLPFMSKEVVRLREAA